MDSLFFLSCLRLLKLLNEHQPLRVRKHVNADNGTNNKIETEHNKTAEDEILSGQVFDLPFSYTRETIEERIRMQMQRYKYVP